MNSPLRILMISPQFHPLLGGYEQAARRLSRGLIARGHRVEVVTERRRRAWAKQEKIDGIAINRIWCVQQKHLHVITTSLSLFFFLLINGKKFDLFHVHQIGWVASVAVLLGRILRKPVLIKLTSTGEPGINSLISKSPTNSFQRRLHRRVDICLVTSDRAAGEARNFGISQERIRRIPNALDTQWFRPLDAEKRSALRDRLEVGREFTALAVGRLDEVKNYEMMIDAWSQFAERRKDVRLVIVGDGPLRETLKAYSADSVACDSIRFIGDVSDPAPWYQASDIFLLSSNREGLSNSLMEALSSGVAILSTRVSGSEDVIRETEAGALVEVGDAAAMAEELRRFHGDRTLLHSCARRAREYAVKNYSMPIVLESIETAYKSSMDQRRRMAEKPSKDSTDPR